MSLCFLNEARSRSSTSLLAKRDVTRRRRRGTSPNELSHQKARHHKTRHQRARTDSRTWVRCARFNIRAQLHSTCYGDKIMSFTTYRNIYVENGSNKTWTPVWTVLRSPYRWRCGRLHRWLLLKKRTERRTGGHRGVLGMQQPTVRICARATTSMF